MKLFRLALLAVLLVSALSPPLHAADAAPVVVGQAQVSGKLVPCYQIDNATVVCTTDLAQFRKKLSWVPGQHPWTTIILAVSAVALIYLFCGLNFVDEWDRRPMKRFGKYIGSLDPGVSWREPLTTRTIKIRNPYDGVDDLYHRLEVEHHSIEALDTIAKS